MNGKMNCNVIIGASFLGSGVMSYTSAFIVYWHVIALLLFILWISERTRIEAVGPVRVFLLLVQICSPGKDLRTWCRSAHLVKICAPGALYSAVLGALLFVGIICCLIGFRSLISPLHSNSGYDWPVRTARILIGLFAPYWLIIPAIAVQRAYK
jgi:mannitol-specific phosphotransferase system IIBC component